MRILYDSKEFDTSIFERKEEDSKKISDIVDSIIEDVKQNGDEALIRLTEKFDHVLLDEKSLKISEEEIQSAFSKVSEEDIKSLTFAVDRIKKFHEKQKEETWISTDDANILLGQKVTPLSKVGIYVPGGKASYPSSVIMNAVPAKVAGVKEIIMVTPTPNGYINPHVVVAAKLSGVDQIYKIGGAQAIAALAYGTNVVPQVDKITGPGNIFVATAKAKVFGKVGIDMFAGPSEILVINDGSGDPSFVASDLIAQAEHDELAASILITTDEAFAKKVSLAIEEQLKVNKRREITEKSLNDFGAIVVVDNIERAVELSNKIAPEHLELATNNPFELLPLIENAGAIFMGHYTPESAGDYVAGPNHTLPTGGTARFFSPLSVNDFIKKSSIICCNRAGLDSMAQAIIHIAELEGLDGHANAVRLRVKR